MRASANTQCKRPQDLTELITLYEQGGLFGGQFTVMIIMILYILSSSALSDIFLPLVMIHYCK